MYVIIICFHSFYCLKMIFRPLNKFCMIWDFFCVWKVLFNKSVDENKLLGDYVGWGGS